MADPMLLNGMDEAVNICLKAIENQERITIYGDSSLGSQVYDGYVRFLGLSGETVAVAVKIKATVTHIVEGQPVPEPVAQETTTTVAEENQEMAATSPGRLMLRM